MNYFNHNTTALEIAVARDKLYEAAGLLRAASSKMHKANLRPLETMAMRLYVLTSDLEPDFDTALKREHIVPKDAAHFYSPCTAEGFSRSWVEWLEETLAANAKGAGHAL